MSAVSDEFCCSAARRRPTSRSAVFHVFVCHLLAEDIQERMRYGAICFGERVFRICGESIGVCGFAAQWAATGGIASTDRERYRVISSGLATIFQFYVVTA